VTNEFKIRRAGQSTAARICPFTNRPIMPGQRFAIYRGWGEISPEGASAHAPAELVKMLDSIESTVGDCAGDDPRIGIGQPHSKQTGGVACEFTRVQFARGGIPYACRGAYDLAIGLGQGEVAQRVSIEAADRLAPQLSAALHKFFGTKPKPRIETPTEQSDREARELAAMQAAEDEQLAAQAASAKRQRHVDAVSAVAGILSVGEVTPVDHKRAERLLDVLVSHFGLTAK
jgi:hypothetical protein